MFHNFKYEPLEKCIEVDNGVICPNTNYSVSAVYQNEKLIPISLDDNEIRNKSSQLSTIFELSDEEVVFAGCFDTNWGFLFIDSISRLWYIIKNNCPLKIAYTLSSESNTLFGQHSSRALELLSYLGIERESLIKIEKPTQFKKVIVPCRSFFHEEFPTYGRKSADAYLQRLKNQLNGHPAFFYTSEYSSIYEKIRTNLPKCFVSDKEKIYFSRRKLKQNKEIGEFAIERVFRKNGFAIYYPELLSVSEQIGLVSSCKILASVEGTLAHNIVFAKPGTQQIILKKQSEFIPRQSMICQAIGIDPIFVESFYEPFRNIPFSHSAGPFLLVAGIKFKNFCESQGMVYVNETAFEFVATFIKYLFRCTYLHLKRTIKDIIKRL